MSRAPRVVFPGAIYHVTSRGNRRAAIYHDQRDHMIWLDTLSETVDNHKLKIHAYCLMPNHYHLLMETVHANLSVAMHQLNALYCQHFNHRHGLTGHVIQGRFHAVNVARSEQMLAVARYISLNPVRAKLVNDAADWSWSSHRYYLAPDEAPAWLEMNWILSQFGSGNQSQRIAAYKEFVANGIDLPNPLQFHKERSNPQSEAAHPLSTYAALYPNRDEAMARAFRTSAYTRQQIAQHFGVSIRTVARAIDHFKSDSG
ncbi:REP-associated tyrosine transposase [Pseudoduganella sp. HUAS MS19]